MSFNFHEIWFSIIQFGSVNATEASVFSYLVFTTALRTVRKADDAIFVEI